MMLQAAFVVVGVIFFAAVVLAVFRIVRGPSILDRMIATDMLVATLICALAAEMVQHEHTRTLPVLLVLAMTAFLATVGVARYVTQQDRPGGPRAEGDAAGTAAGADAARDDTTSGTAAR
ncbi:monovalent cation/H+ antiporter complex subunit F [Planctomonas deserti]|uniref:monovalent cation/H+ antiporter complex subunit F n=1 Tax=Planctomonas deserti TaxID=2144185 RepID=UPI000D3B040A|nr:monovalent cation/H+ antiporter complex subunit F [Planctomonas deserti]